MKIRYLTIFLGMVGLLHWAAIPPAGANDFYAGKTIRVTVGFSAGGGYDTYARLIARHMNKHIPGNPTMIVENMTGAGSLVAANYTYNKAPRDGTFIGVWNSAYVLYQGLGDRAVRIDGRRLGWIGAPVKGSPHCSVMAFSGVKSIDEIVKTGKALKMGATRAGSTYNDLPKVLNQTIGTKFNVITGYPGTSHITVAMRSREVEGGCWGWESARVTARAMLDASGDDKLIPIINHKKWEDKEVVDVPVTRDYIRAKGGDDGVAIYNAWVNQYEFQRPMVAPPGLPKERLDTLRKAFKDTFEDPEFQSEAKKSKLEVEYVSPDEINGLVNEILSISPKTKQGLQFLVRKSKKK